MEVQAVLVHLVTDKSAIYGGPWPRVSINMIQAADFLGCSLIHPREYYLLAQSCSGLMLQESLFWGHKALYGCCKM